MENIYFKKENKTIWITRIYGINPNYLCDISYNSDGKNGSSKLINLTTLALKLRKENFIIQNDISPEHKLDIWKKIMALIK